MLVEASIYSKTVILLLYFPSFMYLTYKNVHSIIQPPITHQNHNFTSMPTATRSRCLRRNFRAALRGQPATTSAKDPPSISPITTPIVTNGDGTTGRPGRTSLSAARRRKRRRDLPPQRCVCLRHCGCEPEVDTPSDAGTSPR